MSKLNQWLTLVANVSVVVGIIFLAMEMRQNTEAIQAQTRDAITEKQMEFSGWIATSRELADAWSRGARDYESLEGADRQMVRYLLHGVLREWENSLYQYEHGLFSAAEFEARRHRWELNMRSPAYLRVWQEMGETFSPSFRAEIDRIVAEVEQAQ